MNGLRTSDVARAIGVHPNTIRLYEEWGLLPPVPRTPSGYRIFAAAHVEQVRLIRLAFQLAWLGGNIKKEAYATLFRAAAGNLPEALIAARQCRQQVQAEQQRAEQAAQALESWAEATSDVGDGQSYDIGAAAALLAVTPDMLRNWERNGLISVPRNPANGYRYYTSREIARLRVIRTLRQARFSLMSILRTMRLLDAQEAADVRQALDTPDPDADDGALAHAFDRFLTTLAGAAKATDEMIAQLQAMMNMKLY